MAKFKLFERIKAGITGLIKGLKGELDRPTAEPQISEEMEHIAKKEEEWQSSYNKRLEGLKDKYRPLFENAQMKYEALESSGLSEYSSAYQNAGGDFSNIDVTDMQSMFREVARAQTFVKDPSSNLEIIKKDTEMNGVNIYAGRGNGDQSLKDFWSAVNKAKETAGIREQIVAKQYSGAFEYAYKVWRESDEPDETLVKTALRTFLDTENEIRAQDFMTPTALKYEISEEPLNDEDYYM